MERSLSRRRRIGRRVFVILLVAVLLSGAWHVLIDHRAGAHPSRADAPVVPASIVRERAAAWPSSVR